MKWWPICLLLVLFVFFWPHYKVVKNPHEMLMLESGCMVYALEYKMALEALERLGTSIWTKVLEVYFYDKTGHAVTIFVYKNYTYVYNPGIGTYVIYERPIYDPLQLAEIIFPYENIKKARFAEPTWLLQYQFRYE